MSAIVNVLDKPQRAPAVLSHAPAGTGVPIIKSMVSYAVDMDHTWPSYSSARSKSHYTPSSLGSSFPRPPSRVLPPPRGA